eukprot:2668773-Amphidinium_carterae.2
MQLERKFKGSVAEHAYQLPMVVIWLFAQLVIVELVGAHLNVTSDGGIHPKVRKIYTKTWHRNLCSQAQPPMLLVGVVLVLRQCLEKSQFTAPQHP